jgi:hypothetical protein
MRHNAAFKTLYALFYIKRNSTLTPTYDVQNMAEKNIRDCPSRIGSWTKKREKIDFICPWIVQILTLEIEVIEFF